jgi:hypothetical protein
VRGRGKEENGDKKESYTGGYNQSALHACMEIS